MNQDGTVLRRKRGGGLSPVVSRSWSASALRLAFWLIVCAFFFGLRWSAVSQEGSPVSRVAAPARVVFSPVPTPAPTASPVLPLLKPSADRPRRPEPKKGIERPEEGDVAIRLKQAREMFVHGRFEEALSILGDGTRKEKSPPDSETAKLGAEIHFALCRRAEANGRYREAGEECARALQSSEHAGAREIFDALEARARKLFLEGYVMEGVDAQGAQERYRKAEETAPPGSPYKDKARGKLGEK